MPRDYYEVLGVGREAGDDEIKKAFRAPRARAASRRQPPRPRGGGEVQGGGRGLRGPQRPRAARAPTTATATRACAPAASSRAAAGFGNDRRHLRGVLRRRRRVRRSAAARGPSRGGDVAVAVEVDARRGARRAPTRRSSFEVIGACSHCHGNGAEPGHADRDLPALRGHRAAAVLSPHASFGQVVRTMRLRPLRRRRPHRRDPLRGVRRRRARRRSSATWRSTSRPGIEDGQRVRVAGARPRRRARRPAPATSTCWSRSPRTSASSATATTWSRALDVPFTDAMLGATLTRPDARGRREVEVARRHPARRRRAPARARACRRCAAAGAATCTSCSNVVVPRRPHRRAARARQRFEDSLEPRTSRRRTSRSTGSARVPRLIRLAVRCRPSGPTRCSPSCSSWRRAGSRRSAGPGYVEYAIYGGQGELPELGELEAAAGGGLVEVDADEVPDDWAERWKRLLLPGAGRRAALSCALLGGAASEGASRGRRRPGPGVRHRHAPDHADVPRAAARAASAGEAAARCRPRAAARACWRSRPRSSASSRSSACDREPDRARGRRATRAPTASRSRCAASTCARTRARRRHGGREPDREPAAGMRGISHPGGAAIRQARHRHVGPRERSSRPQRPVGRRAGGDGRGRRREGRPARLGRTGAGARRVLRRDLSRTYRVFCTRRRPPLPRGA